MAELPDRFQILGCDPGKRNFAWSIMECGKDLPYRVLGSGHFSPTITNMANPRAEVTGFKASIEGSLKGFNPYYACVERFMVRGMNASYNHEVINFSIGIMFMVLKDMFPEMKIYPISAAVWKNHFARHYGNNVAEEILPQYETNLTEHQSDACCICVWSADVDLKRKGLSDIVRTWASKKCDNCFWDHVKDCHKKDIVPTQCKSFEGPCDTCRWQADNSPKCQKWVKKHKQASCGLWKPKLIF